MKEKTKAKYNRIYNLKYYIYRCKKISLSKKSFACFACAIYFKITTTGTCERYVAHAN